MNKFYINIFTLFILLTAIPSFSKSCIPDYIWFHLQSEVDSFSINYPGCSMIEGDVRISGDVINLNGLNILTSIGGDLEIYNTLYLNNCNGLDNLVSIGGDLIISSNYVLMNLAGLQGLASVDGKLEVSYNNSLVSVAALNNIDGSSLDKLSVFHNNSLSGLNHVKKIGGYLAILFNPSLPSLSGLEDLDTLTGLQIYQNNSLVNLEGFESLSYIEQNIDIAGNAALVSLTGIENLTWVGMGIGVYDNNSILSLRGINNVYAGNLNSIYIYNNPLLSECDVESVCDYLAIPGSIGTIESNSPGCNSRDEVEAECGVGIGEDLSTIFELMIYPNPASDLIHVESPERIQSIFIYDSKGDKVIR